MCIRDSTHSEGSGDSGFKPISRVVRLTYGFGAVAYGIKDNGFAYFLLLFYGTVVGLEPALAGTALLIGLNPESPLPSE